MPLSSLEGLVDHESLLLGVATAITYDEDRVGREDRVSLFNGATSKIVYSDIPYDLTGDLSISFKFRIDSFDNTLQAILSSSKLQIYLDGVDGENRIKVSRNGSDELTSTSDILTIDSWFNCLILSEDDGTTNVYVTGETLKYGLYATGAAGTPEAITSFTLGSDGTNHFEGALCDLMIWNRILDDRTRLLSRDILL
jgi:hypothetical protein